jgi:hypothetical protein
MLHDRVYFVQGDRHWQAIVDGQYTDVGVLVENGYRVYKRAPAAGEMSVADRLGDMIGRRVVRAPKGDAQTTEEALIAAIATATATASDGDDR